MCPERGTGSIRSSLGTAVKADCRKQQINGACASGTSVVNTVIDIVDDDDAVRMATQLLLRSFGWRARTFSSAEEYLVALTDSPKPDCLLLDMNMPGMNGAELLEKLMRAHCSVPTIVITGERDPALAARAFDAGAMAVLDKPFRDEQLKDSIDRALAFA